MASLEERVKATLRAAYGIGYGFVIAGHHSYRKILDPTLVHRLKELSGRDEHEHKLRCLEVIFINAQVEGATYDAFLAQLQTSTGLVPLSETLAATHPKLWEKLKKWREQHGAHVSLLVDPSGAHEFFLKVVNKPDVASHEGFDVYMDAESGLPYIGLGFILYKLKEKLCEPFGLAIKSKMAYCHLIIVLNAAKNGLLNPAYYAMVGERFSARKLVDAGSLDVLRDQVHKYKEHLAKCICSLKMIGVSYKWATWELCCKKSLEVKIVSGKRDLANAVAHEKLFVKKHKSPLDCPDLGEEILHATIKHAGIPKELFKKLKHAGEWMREHRGSAMYGSSPLRPVSPRVSSPYLTPPRSPPRSMSPSSPRGSALRMPSALPLPTE